MPSAPGFGTEVMKLGAECEQAEQDLPHARPLPHQLNCKQVGMVRKYTWTAG